MYSIFNTDAFVVGYKNVGDNDRVVWLYTRDYGYLGAYSKSVRKLTSKNRHLLFVGNRINVDLIYSRKGWKITSVLNCQNVSVGLDNLKILMFLFIYIRELMVEGEKDDGVWGLLSDVYGNKIYSDYGMRYDALARLLDILGYCSYESIKMGDVRGELSKILFSMGVVLN